MLPMPVEVIIHLCLCAVLVMSCIYLISNPAFKEGVIGFVGLALIAIFCGLELGDWWYRGAYFDRNFSDTMVLAGVALVFTRRSWIAAYQKRHAGHVPKFLEAL